MADAPEEFESRLERVLAKLTRLKVLLPDKHDLVLMKAVRCYEHILEAIAEIHAHSRLDLEVLLRRFRDEMTPIGDPARIRDNFLLVVERLLPDAVERIANQFRTVMNEV